MITNYILLGIAIIWVIIATIIDVKTKEVPDWLNYSLIGLGLVISGVHAIIYSDVWFFLYSLIGLASMFILANIMYYTKQWGGGDCKLLMGLGAVFGAYTGVPIFNTNLDFPFIAILFFNTLVAGALLGILYAVYKLIKNWQKIKKEFNKRIILEIVISFVLGVAIIIASFIITSEIQRRFLGIGFGVLILLYGLTHILKAVEKHCMYYWRAVDKLVEGDWIVKEVKKGSKVLVPIRRLGLEKKDIEILIKNKIGKVYIKEGMAFVPSFLIGLIVTMIFGNIITLFF